MKKLLSAFTMLLLCCSLSYAQTAPKKPDAKPATSTTKTVPAVDKTQRPVVKKDPVVLKKDGTPDKRYAGSKKLKKDGTPDKRFKSSQ